MALDIFALVVIALLIAVVIWLVVLLGNMPGNVARKHDHPQVAAITALGWIGIITMGMGWFIAMVWAYYIPGKQDASGSDLQERISDLENQLKHLQAGEGES